MRTLFSLTLVLLMVAASFGIAGAQPPLPEIDGGEIIASGFNGPQGLILDSMGDVWVIDSGLGGEDPTMYVSVQTGEAFETMMGQSAQIVKISMADYEQTVVATLPSLVVNPTEITGGARLTLLDGTLYATSGGWIGGTGIDAPDLMGSVVAVGDTVTEVADLWAFKETQNPDGFILESHPYGIAAGDDGWLWIADAAGNSLVRVDPATGAIELVAAFTDGLPGGFPNPNCNGEFEADPVPTAVVPNADGSAYVSFLSGAPFFPGNARVMMVGADGKINDFSFGHTMLTDLVMGSDGELYAVQFGMWGEEGPVPNSGAIIRVKSGSRSEVVWANLPFPTSLAIDGDGNAYVTINGVGAPGSGAVAVLYGLTGMEGTPLPEPGG